MAGIKDGPLAKLAAAQAKKDGNVREESSASARGIRGQKFPYLLQELEFTKLVDKKWEGGQIHFRVMIDREPGNAVSETINFLEGQGKRELLGAFFNMYWRKIPYDTQVELMRMMTLGVLGASDEKK